MDIKQEHLTLKPTQIKATKRNHKHCLHHTYLTPTNTTFQRLSYHQHLTTERANSVASELQHFPSQTLARNFDTHSH